MKTIMIALTLLGSAAALPAQAHSYTATYNMQTAAGVPLSFEVIMGVVSDLYPGDVLHYDLAEYDSGPTYTMIVEDDDGETELLIDRFTGEILSAVRLEDDLIFVEDELCDPFEDVIYDD